MKQRELEEILAKFEAAWTKTKPWSNEQDAIKEIIYNLRKLIAWG